MAVCQRCSSLRLARILAHCSDMCSVDFAGRVVRARRQCQECFGLFLEEELKQGDGRLLPIGSWYCEACHTEAESKARRHQE
jgi:hypothetical protein